jgi:hypothetical protein
MIGLESPRWSELKHAYGDAGNIPALLRQLEAMPRDGSEDPWFTLWSALAHQGDVYPASFAAVPHVVRALAAAPALAGPSFFHFPAWIEICRQRNNVPIPSDLAGPYFEALAQLPSLVAAAAARSWDAEVLVCALSAIAASKGEAAVAEAVLELTPDVAREFMEWFSER